MIIVTGGAGFIGSAVLWELNKKGIDDILIVDNLAQNDKWKNLVNRKFTDFIHKSKFIDLLFKNSFYPVESIIHLGACSSTTETDADYLMENNFHFSQKIAKYCIKRDIRFINASSAATYGSGENGFSDSSDISYLLKPLNMYGYSKQLFDLWALKTGAVKKLVSLKFFNVFGPNEYHKEDMKSVFYKAFFQAKETGCIKLFKSYKKEYPNGGQLRDFIYIKDCVDVIWWFLNNRTESGIFNVGTGTASTWNDLAESVFLSMDKKTDIKYIDMPDHLKDKYQYYTCADTNKLRKAGCQIKFTTIKEAAKDYIRNYLMASDPYL